MDVEHSFSCGGLTISKLEGLIPKQTIIDLFKNKSWCPKKKQKMMKITEPESDGSIVINWSSLLLTARDLLWGYYQIRLTHQQGLHPTNISFQFLMWVPMSIPVSTCEDLSLVNTHRYPWTCGFLTRGSGWSVGKNLHRSGYDCWCPKYPWVRIRVTHKCTRAQPYSRMACFIIEAKSTSPELNFVVRS